MASATKTHVVKVTGVSDDLLRLLDVRVSQRHYGGRAEYLRELLRRDLLDRPEASTPSASTARSAAEIASIFSQIDAINTSQIEPLAPGADSREAIYGNRG